MDASGDNGTEELDSTNWCVFYPIYFDSTRTTYQGRRVSKESGASQPTANDLLQAAQQLGFNCYMESMKRHPKEPFVLGRIRVKPPNDSVSKKELMKKLCQILPPITQANKLKKPNIADQQKKKPVQSQAPGPQLMVRKKKK